jgi:Flp pilus assembly protein TadD
VRVRCCSGAGATKILSSPLGEGFSFLALRRTPHLRLNSKTLKERPLLVGELLVLITLVIFSRACTFDFLSFDDPDYVTANTNVQSGLSVATAKWAFTSFYACNWHPLTWLSHALDWQLYGAFPGGHHFTNVLFHTANVALLFGLLRNLTSTLWRSAFVAALFAWHPLRVESVAWISERKDVLSTFFGLLCIYCYARYAKSFRADVVKEKVFGWYAAGFCFFSLSLLSKPMLVTLPFLLLLLDFWPLGRVDKIRNRKNFWLLAEKTPFLLLSALGSITTFWAQREGGAVQSFQMLPVSFRLSNAALSYIRYIGKTLWPSNLAISYPFPRDLDFADLMGCVFLLLVISTMIVAARRPYLIIGWCWFLGTLVPVIGIIQVGMQSMADRYTYISCIGLFIMMSWGLADLSSRFGNRFWAIAISVTILSFSLVLSWKQLGYWKDSSSLFTHAVLVTENNDIAETHLGLAMTNAGKKEEALAHFREGFRINPNNAQVAKDLGIILADRGELEEAFEVLNQARRLDPKIYDTYGKIGEILSATGRNKDAIACYREGLKVKSDSSELLNNLAWLLVSSAEPELRNGSEAVQLAQKACQITEFKKPIMIGTLAAAYAEAGRFSDAIATANRAIDVAKALGQKNLVRKNEELLQRYRQGQSCCDPGVKSSAATKN